jgi:hypothetical protein
MYADTYQSIATYIVCNILQMLLINNIYMAQEKLSERTLLDNSNSCEILAKWVHFKALRAT